MLPYIKTSYQKARVLIVDDDLAARNLLRIYLKDIGYDVIEAEDGEQAIEIYEEQEFDFLLVDYLMPRMNGAECVKEIKKIKKEQYIPILFLTANDDPRVVEECISVGGDDILIKPFEISALTLKLHAWLRMKESYDQLSYVKNELYTIGLQNELDLEDAKEIIDVFNTFDQSENANIKHINYPANIVSGDICLAAHSPSGNQYILLGDFTGHGLPAGVGVMLVSQTFYAMVAKGFALKEIAKEINTKLVNVLPVNRFMSGCFIELDYQESFATVLNAGMPEIYVFDTQQNLKRSIKSANVPFGIKRSATDEYEIEYLEIQEKDIFIAYSDGLTDTQNAQQEMLGGQRILATATSERVNQSLFEDIIEQYYHFKGDVQPTDDVSLLQIEFTKPVVDDNYSATNSCTRTPSNWSLCYEVDQNIMRETDPVPFLINQLIDIQGIHLPREKLYMILNELYSNSLEHGILGLDSKLKQSTDGFETYYQERQQRLQDLGAATITFEFHHKATDGGGVLNITMIDSGSGFDLSQVATVQQTNLEYKGRGIALIQNLSDHCEYQQSGRQANIEMRWQYAA